MIENLPIILTGLSITASITYYAMVLQNQNKTRKAQMFVNWYNKVTTLEGIEQIRIIRAAKWNNYQEWLDIYQNDADYQRAYSWFITINEGIGVLLKEGLVDIRLLALFLTGPSLELWNHFEDIIYKERERRSYPRLACEWQYSINEIRKYIKEHPELTT